MVPAPAARRMAAPRQRLALGLLCMLLAASAAAGEGGHGVPRSAKRAAVASAVAGSGAGNRTAAAPATVGKRDEHAQGRKRAAAGPAAGRKRDDAGKPRRRGDRAPAPAPGGAVAPLGNTTTPAGSKLWLPALPLKTWGRYIVDQRGQRVKLRCVAWSGGQDVWMVPGGLHRQKLWKIASMITWGGFNCVRLHFSVEMVVRSVKGSAWVQQKAVAANPELYNKGPLEVLDAVIKALSDVGLMVIIDNHTSDAMWCCSGFDYNGLWYTDKWSEADWLHAWDVIARRYAWTPAVIGVGLRNEPRPTIVGGAARSPMWGAGGPGLDLALALEKAGGAVLSHRQSYLVFASGITAARDLIAARLRPLVLRAGWPHGAHVNNQLVYEAHEYFMWYGPLANAMQYEPFKLAMDASWGWVVLTNTAPVWLGEFGVQPWDVHGGWWQSMKRYIKERDLDWSYWLLDGDQGPSRNMNARDDLGLLNHSWDGWEHPEMIEELKQI
ncbi:glycoside hydrolase [Raphidocelis subcapitata]|uniref:Glycoside hydrolase n=1 Tax=Raphidocelis subcapitata TaxID=307507 RepID=A0A2V0P4U9_9CHLO|nr:glycoside hydrolase [Raphidocelis subcapitata]|eukprot:GBF94599.1 glycoside hydrolase [Raphidocelis subcapitata]